jgi:2'-5' RNA ligase
MIRLFVALNIPEEAKDKLIKVRNSVIPDSFFKWEASDKLHLTLKFIDDIHTDAVDEIKSELLFLENYPILKSEFFDFGFFFRHNKPVILWAGMKIAEPINEIVSEINRRLEKYSIQRENRPYKPHLTILRIKNDFEDNLVTKFKNFTFEPINFNSNSISLYKSELLKTGSKYFEIKNYKLKKLEN